MPENENNPSAPAAEEPAAATPTPAASAPAESVSAAIAPCESPPPAAQPPREEIPDPRARLLQLAAELARSQNRRLVIEYLRLRRAV